MPWRNGSEFLPIIIVVVVSLLSGFISISQRITRGHPASLLWIVTEFVAALLCGYLMYDLYPMISDTLPNWATMPILVALSAHIGGRSFQEFERYIHRKYGFGA